MFGKALSIHAAVRELQRSRNAAFSSPFSQKGHLVAPLSVGRIAAGDCLSTVPDQLVAEGRYGVLLGETLADARALFEKTATETARTLRDTGGGDPSVRGVPYASDLSFFTNDAGMPAVLLLRWGRGEA
jgi:hypothetical protein